jgi:hypothetical protein
VQYTNSGGILSYRQGRWYDSIHSYRPSSRHWRQPFCIKSVSAGHRGSSDVFHDVTTVMLSKNSIELHFPALLCLYGLFSLVRYDLLGGALSPTLKWHISLLPLTTDKHSQTPFYYTNFIHGRAIAQAVSRWLPTAVARVRSSGICGESGAGTGFLRVLRFPLKIFIPPNSPSS